MELDNIKNELKEKELGLKRIINIGPNGGSLQEIQEEINEINKKIQKMIDFLKLKFSEVDDKIGELKK